MSSDKKRVSRRMRLLDDLLDYALRSNCAYAFCDGPEAPIRHMRTCSRCACIHRAIKMGLVMVAKHQYVKTTTRGPVVVGKGAMEQVSAETGGRYDEKDHEPWQA